MSMVSLRDPDFARYPKFRDALAAAQSAELEPGDCIFIPPLWWHHVESLEVYELEVVFVRERPDSIHIAHAAMHRHIAGPD